MNAMAGQIVTVPLFATPFAAMDTGADRHFNARLSSLCQSQRADGESASPSDPLHLRGRDDLLESPDPAAMELRRLILGHATSVVSGLSSASTEEFARLHVQARGWSSIVQPGGHIPARHFPGAAWLAIYCAQAGERQPDRQGAGVLRLYERRLASVYRDASTFDMKPPYRYGNHAWTPLPGWMALFPAHVPHEVSVVRSDTPLILVFALLRFMDASATDTRYG